MKNLIYILLGSISYIILSAILIPFLSFGFGHKASKTELIFEFIIEFPFGIFEKIFHNHFVIVLFLNGIFWNSILFLAISRIRRFFKHTM